MSDPDTAWQAWLGTLDSPQRDTAQQLRTRFEALGVPDAADLARSQISEDLPHLARHLLLRSLWNESINPWATPGALEQLPAAQRLLAAGADPSELATLARAVAYECVFTTLEGLDHASDASTFRTATGWAVMERGEDGTPTGRTLAGLHEDLLTTDPSGHDGADLWT